MDNLQPENLVFKNRVKIFLTTLDQQMNHQINQGLRANTELHQYKTCMSVAL